MILKKNHKTISLFLFITNFVFPLEALPSGNPADPVLYYSNALDCFSLEHRSVFLNNDWNFRVGFYGNYVSNRHLMVPKTESTVHEFQVYTNAAQMVFTYKERVDIFGTLGATYLSFQTPVSSLRPIHFPNANGLLSGCTDTSSSYSIGARAVLWRIQDLLLGISGQYFFSRPRLNMFSGNLLSSVVTYVDGERIDYREWQANLGLAYELKLSRAWKWIPYMNLTASHVSTDADNYNISIPDDQGYTCSLFNMNSQKTIGYSLGLSVIGSDKLSIGVEGGFSNEKSLFLSIQFYL